MDTEGRHKSAKDQSFNIREKPKSQKINRQDSIAPETPNMEEGRELKAYDISRLVVDIAKMDSDIIRCRKIFDDLEENIEFQTKLQNFVNIKASTVINEFIKYSEYIKLNDSYRQLNNYIQELLFEVTEAFYHP